MSPSGMSADRLAQAIGIDASVLNDIVHGNRAITIDFASFLSSYFGTTQEYWVKLQEDFNRRGP